ncbi:MAG: hypothetical protein AAB391_00575 [Patescibacteria group bacterium]
MKTLLSVLFALATFCASIQSVDGATNDLANVPDTFLIPTNKVEWTCSAAILGPLVTNDVAYVVKNVQTNRCGVFVVSYPAQLPSPAPIILEILQDSSLQNKSFRLITRKSSIIPGGQPGTPEIEMVEHVEVSFSPERGSTFFAYVNIGKIPFRDNRVMFGRISGPELERRIKGGK